MCQNPKSRDSNFFYLQKAIAFLEQEMILNQLILHVFRHSGQRKISALQFLIGDSFQARLHFRFHFLVIRLGQARIERISGQRATASDTSAVDVFPFRI